MRNIVVRQVLVIISLLVTVGLTINFGILPGWSNFQEKLRETEQSDLLINIELERLQHLQELDRNQPALENQLNFLNTAIPNDLEISNFVDILDVLAERNDVTIEFFVIGDVAPYIIPEHIAADEDLVKASERVGETLRAIPVDFSVSGAYANLVSFIGELQLSPRITLIDNLSLTTSTGTRSLSLGLKTYIFVTDSSEAAK